MVEFEENPHAFDERYAAEGEVYFVIGRCGPGFVPGIGVKFNDQWNVDWYSFDLPEFKPMKDLIASQDKIEIWGILATIPPLGSKPKELHYGR